MRQTEFGDGRQPPEPGEHAREVPPGPEKRQFVSSNPGRFRLFVARMSELIDAAGADEARILPGGSAILAELVEHDDWLPDAFAHPGAKPYSQYLLFCDPRERFSVVCFVWSAGEGTPVHDHTVWGLIGTLRGAEMCSTYAPPGAGGMPMAVKAQYRAEPGSVHKVSPTIGDIHLVRNALTDRPSISIHIYGGNIGAIQRHVFDAASGAVKPFVSGFDNATMPNFWCVDKP